MAKNCVDFVAATTFTLLDGICCYSWDTVLPSLKAALFVVSLSLPLSFCLDWWCKRREEASWTPDLNFYYFHWIYYYWSCCCWWCLLFSSSFTFSLFLVFLFLPIFIRVLCLFWLRLLFYSVLVSRRFVLMSCLSSSPSSSWQREVGREREKHSHFHFHTHSSFPFAVFCWFNVIGSERHEVYNKDNRVNYLLPFSGWISKSCV